MTKESPPDGQGRAPTLHGRIVSEIEARILSGEWPPGHHIPAETDLARDYGCSRMTVNKALAQLARAGLVERRKRSGTLVRLPRAQSAVLQIQDIEAEVRSLGQVYSFTVIQRRVREPKPSDLMRLNDLESGERVLEVCCLHRAGDEPFCLEERVINLRSVPGAQAELFHTLAPGRWLLEQVPWSGAEHRIEAMGAEAQAARLLGLARGAPCLVIERRTWSHSGSVTHVRLTYPGSRHALVATFTPPGAA